MGEIGRSLFPDRDRAESIPSEPGEVWEPIPDFSGYWISNTGRVFSESCSYSDARIMQTSPQTSGYPQVILSRDGEEVGKLVHRLVQRVHGPPRPSDDHHLVNHINADRTDNHVENLEWVTPLENRLHGLIRVYIEKHDLSTFIERIYEWL
jgi:hypothetical protein